MKFPPPTTMPIRTRRPAARRAAMMLRARWARWVGSMPNSPRPDSASPESLRRTVRGAFTARRSGFANRKTGKPPQLDLALRVRQKVLDLAFRLANVGLVQETHLLVERGQLAFDDFFPHLRRFFRIDLLFENALL